jgi:type I restriction enzyme S subunit
MIRWPEVKIGDVAAVFDGPHATPVTVDFGPIFLGIGALQNGRINLAETRHVTPSDFIIWTRRVKPCAGDIVFSYETRLGEAAVIPDGLECCLGRRMGLVRPDRTKLDPRFFLYYYISPKFQEFIRSRTISGATVDRIALKEFPNFPVFLPPLGQQVAIGSLLGALDDKIELNKRMNETLEAMARAIFRDWFVDFGPTRAKAEGRAPYLTPEIWSLFPDQMDDEGKPWGWLLETVYEQADWVNGAAYKNMHFSSEKDALPVVKIAELKNGVTSTTRFTNTSLGERYKIYNEDLLFSWSGNPDTSIDAFIWTSGDAWLNQHIFLVKPNGKKSQGFLFSMLKLLRSEFSEIARNKQTTGLGHVTKQDLIRLKITAPDKAVCAMFDDLVGPLHARYVGNLFESQTLAATRDLLLPKLMSGEIRVKDAERLAETSPEEIADRLNHGEKRA